MFCVFSVVGVEWCKQNKAILPHSLVPNVGHATVLLTPEVNTDSQKRVRPSEAVAALLIILTQEKNMGGAHGCAFILALFAVLSLSAK